MTWLLIILNLDGGTPAIVYMADQHSCEAAQTKINEATVSFSRVASAVCISGGETIDQPEQ
jgi:hypothetical protein